MASALLHVRIFNEVPVETFRDHHQLSTFAVLLTRSWFRLGRAKLDRLRRIMSISYIIFKCKHLVAAEFVPFCAVNKNGNQCAYTESILSGQAL
jgi:hypothetical protein